MTGEQMCERISQYLRDAYGLDVAPMDMWNYSPRGELYLVFELYREAEAYYRAQAASKRRLYYRRRLRHQAPSARHSQPHSQHTERVCQRITCRRPHWHCHQ